MKPESLCRTLQGDAAAALERAQALCHRDNQVNMRHILEFLIPVHMLRGRLPPTELLERYKLQALKQISQVKYHGRGPSPKPGLLKMLCLIVPTGRAAKHGKLGCILPGCSRPTRAAEQCSQQNVKQISQVKHCGAAAAHAKAQTHLLRRVHLRAAVCWAT